jgi:hypothetical protein
LTGFCPTKTFWNLPTKATQIDCILLSRAAKDFGIRHQNKKQLKSTGFCPTVQRKFLEFANKSNSNWLYFVQPRSERFGIRQQN